MFTHFINRFLRSWGGWLSSPSARKSSGTSTASSKEGPSVQQVPGTSHEKREMPLDFNFRTASGHSSLLNNGTDSFSFSSEITDATQSWLSVFLDTQKILKKFAKIEALPKASPEIISLFKKSLETLNSFTRWWLYSDDGNTGEKVFQEEFVLQTAIKDLEEDLNKNSDSSVLKNLLSSLQEWKTACQEYAFTLALAKQERAAFKNLGPITRFKETKKNSQGRKAFIEQEQRANRLETETYQLREKVAKKSKKFFHDLYLYLEVLAASSLEKEQVADSPRESESSTSSSLVNEQLINEQEQEIEKQELSVSTSTSPLIKLFEEKSVEEEYEKNSNEQIVADLSGKTLLDSLSGFSSNNQKLAYLVKLRDETHRQLADVQKTLQLGNHLNFKAFEDQRTNLEEKIAIIRSAIKLLQEQMEEAGEEINLADASIANSPEYQPREQRVVHEAPTGVISFVPRESEDTKISSILLEETFSRYENGEKFSGEKLLEPLFQKYTTSTGKFVRKQLIQRDLNNLKNYTKTLIEGPKKTFVFDEIADAQEILDERK